VIIRRREFRQPRYEIIAHGFGIIVCAFNDDGVLNL